MKIAIFTSSAIAALSTFVAAQSTSNTTNCWMELGQYTTGGAFCVEPLPDFTNQAGCQTSETQCIQEYQNCKSETVSVSACLVLMSRCQILANFCNTYCAPDANGNAPSTCNLATANSWNGVATITASTSVQQAQTPTVSTTAAVATPVVAVATSTTAAAVAATSAALIAPDVPCGQCFIDGSNGRRGFESGPHYAPSGSRMTIGTCMSICQGLGYKYTGVEFSQECWCGNSFLNGGMPTAASACTMTCQGDSTEICGGNLLMNVYQSGCATPTATAKSTTSVAATVNQAASTSVAAYNVKTSVATAAANNAASTSVAAVAAASVYVSYTPTVGICSIPTAYATPIAGYHAPIVACNDLSDYTTKPWKLYNSHYTSQCPTYSSGSEANACIEACSTQYSNCIADYANTFKTYSSSSTSAYKIRRGLSAKNEKRSWWGYGSTSASTTTASTSETLSSATAKCYAQYSACWSANQNLKTQGTCSAGGIFHAPSSQSGSSTYNSATKSYGSYNTANTYAQSSSSTYGGSTTNDNDYWKE